MTDTAAASPPRGFDADQRAAEREQAGVTIGESRYRPVRKTTAVMRDVRRIGRAQERLGRRAERLEREADDLYGRADDAADQQAAEDHEARAEELVGQADALRDEASSQTFVMLSTLLATDDGQHPEAAALEGALDLADAQALAEYLMPNTTAEPDPTPPTGTTST